LILLLNLLLPADVLGIEALLVRGVRGLFGGILCCFRRLKGCNIGLRCVGGGEGFAGTASLSVAEGVGGASASAAAL
jgi:hypothetical protein